MRLRVTTVSACAPGRIVRHNKNSAAADRAKDRSLPRPRNLRSAGLFVPALAASHVDTPMHSIAILLFTRFAYRSGAEGTRLLQGCRRRRGRPAARCVRSPPPLPTVFQNQQLVANSAPIELLNVLLYALRVILNSA